MSTLEYEHALNEYAMRRRGKWPVPHTTAWFDLDFIYNMDQAMHCLRIITLANGDLEVCGICGDKPAEILIARGNPTDHEFPVRYCEDCQDIQSGWGATLREPAPGEVD